MGGSISKSFGMEVEGDPAAVFEYIPKGTVLYHGFCPPEQILPDVYAYKDDLPRWFGMGNAVGRYLALLIITERARTRSFGVGDCQRAGGAFICEYRVMHNIAPVMTMIGNADGEMYANDSDFYTWDKVDKLRDVDAVVRYQKTVISVSDVWHSGQASAIPFSSHELILRPGWARHLELVGTYGLDGEKVVSVFDEASRNVEDQFRLGVSNIISGLPWNRCTTELYAK